MPSRATRSGSATGLGQEGRSRPSVLRRHPMAVMMAWARFLPGFSFLCLYGAALIVTRSVKICGHEAGSNAVAAGTDMGTEQVPSAGPYARKVKMRPERPVCGLTLFRL